MQVKNHMILLKHNCKSKGNIHNCGLEFQDITLCMVDISPIFYSFCLHMYVMLCPHHDIFVFFTIYYILNIMTHVEGFLIYLWWFLELWFSYAQIFETRHRITLPHRNMLMTFYKSIIQAKSLRKIRQMKEMFAVLLHYTH